MKPIKIIGSGPSGLSAAINLAKAGREVHVFEKNADCGQRFHGDLEGLENWSKREDVLEELERMCSVKLKDFSGYRSESS